VEAQWQPQVGGVQPQPPDEADELEEEFVPLEGAAAIITKIFVYRHSSLLLFTSCVQF
jgi:hypothetical protein